MAIIGLKEKESGEIFTFKQDPALPYTASLNADDVKKFKKDAVYEVLIEDYRLKDMKSLTKEELEHVKQEFDVIDIDKSGEISMNEIKLFYDKQRDDTINNLKSILDKRLALAANDEEKEEMASTFNNKKETITKLYDGKYELAMAGDVDNTGTITFDEFLCHEGIQVLKSRIKK